MRRTSLLFLLVSLAFAAAGEPKSTRSVLNKYFDDLTTAWQTYPTDKQKDVRDAQVRMLQDAFNKELVVSEVPANSTLAKILTAYVISLDKVKLNFRQEKQVNIRSQYLAGCAAVFKREVGLASDLAEPRTTQQVFELMLNMMEEARNGTRANSADVQKQVFGGVNETIGALLPNATVPEKGDPIVQLDENLKEARRRFPVTDKAKINEPALSHLEARAKEIQEIAAKKAK